MTETDCKMSSCEWKGHVDDLFDHFEQYHRQYIREIRNPNHFEFTLTDFERPAFLLCGHNGLYWFVLDPIEDASQIRRGIFAIGDSEPMEYTLKVGRLAAGRCEYLGPFKTQSLSNESIEYELEFPFAYLEFMHKEFDPQMLLYFGTFDDSDDVYTGTWECIDWNDPEQVRLNEKWTEKFTCSVCLEFIKSEAKFCQNQHFLCSECFNKLDELRAVKCPICRGSYSYDCESDAIENLLKLVKFPDE